MTDQERKRSIEDQGIVNSFLGITAHGKQPMPPSDPPKIDIFTSRVERPLFQDEEEIFPLWMTGLIILGVLVITLLMTNGWEISWIKL